MTIQSSDNNKRIAKNTMLLYFRMIFTMAVSLYTSRVVLNTLGVEDFGIYNVVGGIIAMFSFLNSAMSTATQRYITFELGKGSFLQLQKVFSTSVSIHVLIAILILILGESVGVWFLYNKMIIPADRIDAAFWVFQFSIFSMMTMIVSVPYNASIIAHEKMSAFAYISVLEVSLKLGIVYLLTLFGYDKLILYAFLLFSMQLVIRFVYGYYCGRHFKETKYHFVWDTSLFKEMLVFAGWNLWGNCAGIAFTQGLNILLNLFFGPTVNAARAVAVQIQSAVLQFSSNFQTALNPQITKSYATNDIGYMHSLLFRSSKFTFLLLFTLSLPVLIEAEIILKIWLNIVPDYTIVFTRLILCVTIIDSMANPLMVAAAATGRVRRYQSVVGGILLSILPLSYIVLKLGAAPWSVFTVHLFVCIVAFIVRLFIIRPMISLSIWKYMQNVLVKVILVIITSLPLPFLLNKMLPNTISSFILVCILCLVVTTSASYAFGLNPNERIFINKKISAIVHKQKTK